MPRTGNQTKYGGLKCSCCFLLSCFFLKKRTLPVRNTMGTTVTGKSGLCVSGRALGSAARGTGRGSDVLLLGPWRCRARVPRSTFLHFGKASRAGGRAWSSAGSCRPRREWRSKARTALHWPFPAGDSLAPQRKVLTVALLCRPHSLGTGAQAQGLLILSMNPTGCDWRLLSTCVLNT